MNWWDSQQEKHEVHTPNLLKTSSMHVPRQVLPGALGGIDGLSGPMVPSLRSAHLC